MCLQVTTGMYRYSSDASVRQTDTGRRVNPGHGGELRVCLCVGGEPLLRRIRAEPREVSISDCFCFSTI